MTVWDVRMYKLRCAEYPCPALTTVDLCPELDTCVVDDHVVFVSEEKL